MTNEEIVASQTNLYEVYACRAWSPFDGKSKRKAYNQLISAKDINEAKKIASKLDIRLNKGNI